MLNFLRPAVVLTLIFIGLTGIIYPLLITGVAQVIAPKQANGELISDPSGSVVGSRLIAQAFTKPQYLHPRPSAAGSGYDASNSGGTNMGPLNPKLAARMAADAALLRREAPNAVIPADAVTTSGSGLDPDISPENALLQAPRIAAARHVAAQEVTRLIEAHTAAPLLGFIGQPHVNVLEVNRFLDKRLPVVLAK